MSSTKYETYVGTILVVALLAVLLATIGVAAYNNSNIELDQKSQSYILTYADYVDEAGFTEISETQIGETAEKDILSEDNETGEIIATDNFAIIKSAQAKFVSVPNFLKLIYNLPTLSLYGLGLTTTKYNPYINILGYIFSFLILGTIVKLIFNGGQT